MFVSCVTLATTRASPLRIRMECCSVLKKPWGVRTREGGRGAHCSLSASIQICFLLTFNYHRTTDLVVLHSHLGCSFSIL